MKAFQLDNPKIIYFENLERIPADQELEKLKKELEAAGCDIGAKKEAGLDDIYECKMKGMEFEIIFSEGEATIYAGKKETKDFLMKMFA